MNGFTCFELKRRITSIAEEIAVRIVVAGAEVDDVRRAVERAAVECRTCGGLRHRLLRQGNNKQQNGQHTENRLSHASREIRNCPTARSREQKPHFLEGRDTHQLSSLAGAPGWGMSRSRRIAKHPLYLLVIKCREKCLPFAPPMLWFFEIGVVFRPHIASNSLILGTILRGFRLFVTYFSI